MPVFERSNSGASSIDSSSCNALLAADCVIDIAPAALCSDLRSSSAISNCSCFIRNRDSRMLKVSFMGAGGLGHGESKKRSQDGNNSIYLPYGPPYSRH